MAPLTMSTVPRHNPPGFPFVDDLTLKNKEMWSRDFISTWMRDEISGGPNICPNETPSLQLTQFFDGTVTPFDTSQAGLSIGPWKAFPGKVSFRKMRWAL